jgi:hypothetical protein
MNEKQPLLRVRGWDELYENNRSREIAQLAYFLAKNDLADDTYVFVTDHPDGAAHLGGWHAILMLASRVQRPYRGFLRRSDGKPHDARSLALATRLPVELFGALIPRLLEIGLLEDANAKQRKSKALPSQKGAEKPQVGAAKPQVPDDRTEQNLSSSSRTEFNGTEATASGTERTGTERARESAALSQSRAAAPSNSPEGDDDDENPPEQRLFGLFEQNGEVLTADTLQRIRENLEVREVDLMAYVAALAPKLKPNGKIVSATAIALDLAKKFGSKTTPARIPRMPKAEKPKCPTCHTLDTGRGLVLADDGKKLVPCPMCATQEYKLLWTAKETEREAKSAREGAA